MSKLELIKNLKVEHFPICMSKTQYSLSDDPKVLGRPKDFVLNVTDIEIKNGAGFVVVMCGDIIAMPGLGKDFAALHLDIDNSGNPIFK